VSLNSERSCCRTHLARPVDNDGVDLIEVGDAGIRLGQLLKLAGLVDSGGEAKQALLDGTVTVNGLVETRRGAQLRPGDVIHVPGATVQLT
jgi:ribosome-associated protein